jgi:TolB-like protein/DNA-binding winged helix-turn-helix (wHTH) protein
LSAIRFGDELELDAAAYELRRAGRAVRLERIPMEILLLLVERHGDLVTREQIVERLWGPGVHVETDNSINVAIRKLRAALRDDPENPRFIRTVTAKGYRFVGEIEAPAAVPVPAPVPAPPPPSPARSRAARWVAAATAVAILVAAGAYLLRVKPAAASRAPSGRVMLAVLPFENFTGDPAQEYLSDGLTEEMIGRLGNLAPEKLGVIARTSVMRYKRDPQPLSRVGEELGVQYVLEGSVRRDSRQVRITAQLVRVADQTHVWARQYDRDPQELLRVQAEIADAIASEIQITLADGERTARPSPLTPEEVQAYDDYLAGRHAWNERSPAGFRRAIASFERAIANKPGYAHAYAGLADCYALIGIWGLEPAAEVIPKARAAALESIRLDGRGAQAHTSLALITEAYDHDWATAESHFRRAIELDPNYVTARHWYAELLAFQGRFDDALAEIERARKLDPLSPIVATDRGAILYFARRYDAAVEQFLAVLAAEPGLGRARMVIAAYAQQGRLEEARAQLEAWRRHEQVAWWWAWEAYVLGRAGKAPEARRAFGAMEAANRVEKREESALYATALVGMGANDEALTWLEKACRERSPFLNTLKVDPIFDPLRDDPRFEKLLRCAHFRVE